MIFKSLVTVNVRDEMVSLPETQEGKHPGLDIRKTQFLVSTLVNCPCYY